MVIERFEDIIAWKKSQELAQDLYRTFGTCRDLSFRDQILRAVLSISNNIAEGFERQSNKELRNFLYIAKGSCGEARSMLYLANKLGYINNKDFERFLLSATEISKMLSGFIKTIQTSH